MKQTLLLLLLTSSFCAFGQSQDQMHQEAREAYRKADLELNEVYQKILVEYQSDTLFIDQLKKTQRIWISYRDAELEMKFPAENKQAEYGSAYPLCAFLFLTELTQERTEKLSVWLRGIEEGEICAGSVRAK